MSNVLISYDKVGFMFSRNTNNFVGGFGLSFAYVPVMTNLTRWFPERRGFATGATVCGFGGGALVAAPLTERLLEYGKRAPEYVGRTNVSKTNCLSCDSPCFSVFFASAFALCMLVFGSAKSRPDTQSSFDKICRCLLKCACL